MRPIRQTPYTPLHAYAAVRKTRAQWLARSACTRISAARTRTRPGARSPWTNTGHAFRHVDHTQQVSLLHRTVRSRHAGARTTRAPASVAWLWWVVLPCARRRTEGRSRDLYPDKGHRPITPCPIDGTRAAKACDGDQFGDVRIDGREEGSRQGWGPHATACTAAYATVAVSPAARVRSGNSNESYETKPGTTATAARVRCSCMDRPPGRGAAHAHAAGVSWKSLAWPYASYRDYRRSTAN